MNIHVVYGLLIPFAGTSLGAMMVLFMKREIKKLLQRILTGFAAGIMISASFFSLLIPAIDQSKEAWGKLSVLPASFGFCLGMAFLLLIDTLTPHMHLDDTIEGPKSHLKKDTMLFLAVVIHNIPEGIAVGVLYAGWLQNDSVVSLSAAISLSLGIAIQNFPEGAIISMPLHANGMSRKRACFYGIMSGAVEPLAGGLTVALSSLVVPFMPVLLSFAAGAMIYVIVEELIPEMSEGKHSNRATVAFMIGFVLMMILDIALG